MSFTDRIHELVQSSLADDHRINVVGFIDQLLLLVGETGEVRCSLATERELCFQTPGQPERRVELGRAKSKLRMLCARLAKLRQDSGQEFEPYGGEGIITRDGVEKSRAEYAEWMRKQHQAPVEDRDAAYVAPAPESPIALTLLGERWKVSYKNTMGQQEFTVIAE